MKIHYILFLLGMICLPSPGQANPPDWEVQASDFQYSTSVTGIIEFDRVPAGNPADLLAAFVGEELRGVCSPIYVENLDRYYIFLNVASNLVSGETVTFKYFQAESEQITALYDEVQFVENTVIGSLSDPFIFSNIDEEMPTVKTKNISIALDETGQANIQPSDVDDGSADDGNFTLSLDKSSFSCSDLGESRVILTAQDADGHSVSSTATVTIMDAMAPVVKAKSISLKLAKEQSEITITADQVDDGSYDNCSIAKRELSRSTFGKGDIGEQQLILTVTDETGNVASAAVSVNIVEVEFLAANFPENKVEEIEYFPNPTSDVLRVKADLFQHQRPEFRFYDIQGRQYSLAAIRSAPDEYTFKLEGLPTGIYSLRILTQDELSVVQVIKN